MRDFIDKTVLITGAARGMGASHARGFAKQGAHVIVADVLEDQGRALTAELQGRARQRGDPSGLVRVSRWQVAWQRAFSCLDGAHGRAHALAAGEGHPGSAEITLW